MRFSVCNDGTKWSLDICQDSNFLSVTDFDKDVTMSYEEKPTEFRNFLLSQRQEFLITVRLEP